VDLIRIGAPETAIVTASCWKTMPTVVSPWAAALTGADPDLVYWLTLACSFLR